MHGQYRTTHCRPRERPFRGAPASPRLGLAWDVSSDHRTVVRAHVGRTHDPVYNHMFRGPSSLTALYDYRWTAYGCVDDGQSFNQDGSEPFDTSEFKALGTYHIPKWGGLNVSAVYRWHSGQSWGRQAWATGLRLGRNRVRIEPRGTRVTDPIDQLDLRIEKLVRLRRTTFGLYVDVFNVTNRGVPDAEVSNAVDDMSGPTFGRPLAWTDPRTVQLGLRLKF